MNATTKQRPGGALVTQKESREMSLKAYFDARKTAISEVIAGDLTPERMTRIFLADVSRDRNLMACTPASLYLCVHQSAQLGLEIGTPLGHAYAVPYKDQAVFIPGYRGLIYLAVQCGMAKEIDAHIVYENDDFTLKYGLEDACEWEPNVRGDRGQPLGVLTILTRPDGSRDCRFIDEAEILLAKEASRAKNGDLWGKYWREAWRKTAIRRHLKRLALSPAPTDGNKLTPRAALNKAVHEDPEFDVIDVEAVDNGAEAPAEKAPTTRTEQVKAQVRKGAAPKNGDAKPDAAAVTTEPTADFAAEEPSDDAEHIPGDGPYADLDGPALQERCSVLFDEVIDTEDSVAADEFVIVCAEMKGRGMPTLDDPMGWKKGALAKIGKALQADESVKEAVMGRMKEWKVASGAKCSASQLRELLSIVEGGAS